MLTKTPVGLDEIIRTFGSIDDPMFEQKYIVAFKLPYPLFYEGTKVTKARCHTLIVDNFLKAFREIKAAGLQDQVKNYSGIYARRSIRGFGSHPSTHSWGIAIDLEAEKFPLGRYEAVFGSDHWHIPQRRLLLRRRLPIQKGPDALSVL